MGPAQPVVTGKAGVGVGEGVSVGGGVGVSVGRGVRVAVGVGVTVRGAQPLTSSRLSARVREAMIVCPSLGLSLELLLMALSVFPGLFG